MRYDWGILEIGPTDRTGVLRRHRLIVFPPGTNASERRAYRFWRMWPGIGVFASLIVIVLSSLVLTSAGSLVAATAVFVSGFVGAFGPTRSVRRGIRRMTAYTARGNGGIATSGDVVALECAALALLDLDRARDLGAIGPVEYELGWAEIWRRIDDDAVTRKGALTTARASTTSAS